MIGRDEIISVAEWLNETCGIIIQQDRSRFEIYDNPRGNTSCEGRIYYDSHFARGRDASPKISIDLTADEIPVMPASTQKVIHGYSDEPDEGMHINCYAYPEVFGEKVRALGERGRPSGLETIPGEGEAYRPAYGRLNLGSWQNRPLEIIRFAAANRLCVDLDYTDKNGHRKIRTIEAYSLRRTSTGNTLLCAVRADDGQTRTYPVQGINNATLTHRTFSPRFKLELSPT